MPFHLNTDTLSYPTCIQHNLHQYKTKHEYAKRCIRYDIPITINNFAREVLDKIDTHGLQGFVIYVKAYILQTYQETCTIVNCYICNQ